MMSATVKIGPHTYTLEDWRWSGEDEQVVAILNGNLPPYGPSGSDPDPAGNEAERMAEMFGGEVVRRDPVESEPNAVY